MDDNQNDGLDRSAALGAALGENSFSLRPVPPPSENVSILASIPAPPSLVVSDPAARGAALSPLLALVQRAATVHDFRVALETMRAIRLAIPVADSAILKRRELEGVIEVEAKDRGLEKALQDFIFNVPVGTVVDNPNRTGLDRYLDALADASDEYGQGFGQIQYDEGRSRAIRRLVIPDSRTFRYEAVRGAGGMQTGDYALWQSDARTGWQSRIDAGAVHTLAFGYDAPFGGVWARPLFWGLPIVSEIIVRMFGALSNLWWRSGDAATLYAVAYDKEVEPPVSVGFDGQRRDTNLFELATQTTAAHARRAQGYASDVFFSAKGGKLERTSLTADPASSTMAGFLSEHMDTIAGQFVMKSAVPAWMFAGLTRGADGLGSDRSSNETDLALTAADRRNSQKLRIAYDIVNRFLLSEGSRTYDFRLFFRRTAELEEKARQEARKAREEADAKAIANVLELDATGVFGPMPEEGDEAAQAAREATIRANLEGRGVRLYEAP